MANEQVKRYFLSGETATKDFDAVMDLATQILGREPTLEEREEAYQEWINEELPPEWRAVNSEGQLTSLPAKPDRRDFLNEEDWEEALASWNHSVAPLLRKWPETKE